MNVSPVSFGRKIPIGQCKIKDTKQNKPVRAIFYELDGRSNSDLRELEKMDSSWKYKKPLLHLMKYKLESNSPNKYRFFVMENTKGDILGIAQIKNETPDLVLDYLETTKKEDYKYIGQSILAFLGEYGLKNGFREIYVPIPIKESRNFYTKKCGFKKAGCDDSGVVLSKFGIKLLQHKVKKRVES